MSVELEIKAEAARKQMPLKRLAEIMGTYPEKLSRSFTGKRELKSSEIEAAAKALRIPASELMRRAEQSEAVQQ